MTTVFNPTDFLFPIAMVLFAVFVFGVLYLLEKIKRRTKKGAEEE